MTTFGIYCLQIGYSGKLFQNSNQILEWAKFIVISLFSWFILHMWRANNSLSLLLHGISRVSVNHFVITICKHFFVIANVLQEETETTPIVIDNFSMILRNNLHALNLISAFNRIYMFLLVSDNGLSSKEGAWLAHEGKEGDISVLRWRHFPSFPSQASHAPPKSCFRFWHQ